MLLQTNSYVVPRDRKAEHARLVRRFRQTFTRLGCDSFEVYEQVGSNWSAGDNSGRFVQIMRFRDRRHQLAVQEAERNDPDAQALIAEFCELINFPYQRQQGLFAVGFYISVLPTAARRQPELTDKTIGPEGEIEEEEPIAGASGAKGAHQQPGPPKPAALVEPGAATRAPIVPPVGPGQVPIITPAPLAEPLPAEESAATAQPPASEDKSTFPLGEFDDISDLDDSTEPAIADSSAAPAAPPVEASAASAAPSANPRWQTSDDLADGLDADVTTNLTDADENGHVRVADEGLLQAEADFAEYAAEPVGAFDEIKPKPPVLEGSLLDEEYIGVEPVPMDEDAALKALEMPLVNGESGGETGHFEKEIKKLSEEHEGEVDAPPKHDEVAG